MSRFNGLVFLSTLLGAAALGVVACGDDGNLGGSSGSSTSSGGTATTEEVSGEIAGNRTLAAGKDYLLKGLVSVKAGATLTIEKGVTIKGDSASKAILLVEPGGKIMAEGTADEPIVFTSQADPSVRRAGDWGGLVLLGKAPVNIQGGKGNIEGILKTVQGTEFGGTDAEDSSGVMRYVRIEYAGVILSPDNEVNGLTFGGVGRGTKIDHIMVRHALDDCYEFFGGTVDAHHLICQYNQDDGFDFDNGYSGRLQFLVLQQDPNHPGEDNGVESDNDAQGSGNSPFTAPQVYNATLIGKNADPEGPQYGLLLRRNSRGTYANLIVTGFEAGLDVRDSATATAIGQPIAGQASLSLTNSLFWNSKGTGVIENIAYGEKGASAPDKDNDNAFDEVAWIKGNNNVVRDPGLMNPFDPKAPVFGPAQSITDVAVAPPNDGFFDSSAKYLGAFKDANDTWATTGKWVSWDSK